MIKPNYFTGPTNMYELQAHLSLIRRDVPVCCYLLHRPELYANEVKDVGNSSKGLMQYVAYNTSITFTDDGVVLCSKPHNRPLFVISYIKQQIVKHILVDGGSTINIISKCTMNNLGIIVEELSKQNGDPSV